MSKSMHFALQVHPLLPSRLLQTRRHLGAASALTETAPHSGNRAFTSMHGFERANLDTIAHDAGLKMTVSHFRRKERLVPVIRKRKA
jgi:hypothetical protein